jgi:hypothetical protein
MKKKIFGLLLTCLLTVALVIPAFAEDFQGESGWTVNFAGSKLDSNFTSADMSEAASGLQPGDSITFTVTLKNTDSESTDWWMTNKVLSSFEDNSTANGGAYTYELIYVDGSGTQNVLYSSQTVGGENNAAGEGLHSATGALEDYFYLDTLSSGQSGTLTLQVALDGETQGNAYQNTLADLQLNFAVEMTASGSGANGSGNDAATTTTGKSSVTKTAKTGDPTQMVPYVVMTAVAGVVILILAIFSLKRRKKETKGAA